MTNEVVLIYPPYKDLIREADGILEPLSLTYIAGYLRKYKIPVSIIDVTAENISLKKLAQIIIQKNPKVVGIYANVPLVLKTAVVAKIIKGINQNIKVVVGGHQATALPRETLENFSCFDIMVIGEGEQTMLELVRELNNFSPNLNKVNGVAYRQAGKIIITPKRELIKDIDSIPFPSRDLVNFSNYRPPTKAYFKKPFATMITSRGCPYNCIFCAYARGTCRLRSPENVFGEIKQLKKNYGVKSILFYDDTLTFNKERMIKICDLMIQDNIDIEWACWSRVDAVNLDLLKKMKTAGCQLISYGVESGSQEMLNIMKKGTTLEQIKKAIQFTKEIGIQTSASYVLGIPGETLSSINKTVDFAKELDTTFAHFNMITPWPGTELYKTLLENNKISKDEWKQYAKKSNMQIPIIEVGDLTIEELKKIPWQAYKKFYLRPKKIYELAKLQISLYKAKSYLLALKAFLKLR